jgi:PhnB protein
MSMAKINAYLVFNSNCRQAMAFYKECFGGELKLETVKGSPMESHWPQVAQHNIVHARLENEQLTILASDMGRTRRYFKKQFHFSCPSLHERQRDRIRF